MSPRPKKLWQHVFPIVAPAPAKDRTKGLAARTETDERGAYLSPAASRVHNREQKLTGKEEEGDRSTQQNSVSDFCIVALYFILLDFFV